MSFFKTNVLFKLFYPIIILTLISFSCSTDNSITGSSNQTNLSKPNDIENISSPGSNDEDGYDFFEAIKYIFNSLNQDQQEACIFFSTAIFTIPGPISKSSKAYDFRDNYPSKSETGNGYIASYYILSNYGIENDLVMRHSLEHLSLMNAGIDIARNLQHGTNNNKILINRSIYDDCKDIVKIYRNSESHEEIDPILDYLEADLEKYYNKTKAEIAVDFE